MGPASCQEAVGPRGEIPRGTTTTFSPDDVLLRTGPAQAAGTPAAAQVRREVDKRRVSLRHGRFWKLAGGACAVRPPPRPGRSRGLPLEEPGSASQAQCDARLGGCVSHSCVPMY